MDFMARGWRCTYQSPWRGKSPAWLLSKVCVRAVSDLATQFRFGDTFRFGDSFQIWRQFRFGDTFQIWRHFARNPVGDRLPSTHHLACLPRNRHLSQTHCKAMWQQLSSICRWESSQASHGELAGHHLLWVRPGYSGQLLSWQAPCYPLCPRSLN